MTINNGDTAWVLVSTLLVFLMTPGLALFYGGLVRKKNVLSTTMHSYIAIAFISILWVLVGYSLAFGPDRFGLIGDFSWIGLKGVGMEPNPDYSSTIPALLFMAFQMMFAIITPALISGAIAERMRFSAYLAFIVIWSLTVYNLLAHWVWGVDGWIRNLGALDFAGGTVVHILSGVSALIAAIVIGRRTHGVKVSFVPHNLPMTILGAGILWFGWFGFNAGSALGANGLAALAFVNTNSSAAAAALSWVIVEWAHGGKPTALGAVSGAVAGLVSITPAAGFVTPLSSLAVGFVGGIVCYLAVVLMKKKFGYDDSLDAFGIHGIGGAWGAVATGMFATTTVNSLGADGLFYGNPGLLTTQLIAVGATVLAAAIGTFVILKGVSLFVPLRVTEEEEEMGLDICLHGEWAYNDASYAREEAFETAVQSHGALNSEKVAIN